MSVRRNQAGNWICTVGGKSHNHGPGVSGRAAARRQQEAYNRAQAKRKARKKK